MPTTPLAEPDPTWEKVLAEWERPAAHDAFLGAMAAAGRLGDAAARYRVLRDDPVRGETARKRLGAVAILAEQALAATMDRPEPARFRRRLAVVAAIVCATLIGMVLWALTRS